MGKPHTEKKKNKTLKIILAVLFALVVLASSWLQYIPLKEGSLPHAILALVGKNLNEYVNFFPVGNLSKYGMAPVSLFAIITVIAGCCGLGLGKFILGAISFYSLYIGVGHFMGEANYRLLSVLPVYYFPVTCGIFIASTILLLAKKGKKKDKKAKNDKTVASVESASVQDESIPSETQMADQTEDEIEDVSAQDMQEEMTFQRSEDAIEEKSPILESPALSPESRKALKSLSDIKVPEFKSFPNYSMGSMIGSVDRSIFDISGREAALREEAERKRMEAEKKAAEEERLRQKLLEEELAKKAAEEERKKLENMFKPRNLMKRLSEEAQAEKEFASFGSRVPSVDYGLSANQPTTAPEPQTQNVQPEIQEVKVQNVEFQSVQPQTPQFVQPSQPVQPAQPARVQPSFQNVPPSQQFFQSFQNQMPPVGGAPAPQPQQEPKIGTVFKEASIEAELERQNQDALRAAEQQRKADYEKHLLAEKRAEQERLLAEIKAAEEARLLAEAKAKAMEEAKIAAEAQAAKLVEEAKLAAEAKLAQEAAAKVVKPEPEEDDDLDAAQSKFMEEVESEKEEKKSKLPDIDEVSGVAGLKSSAAGNSYLIDKQKFDYHFPPEDLLKHYPISATIYEDPLNDPDGQTIVETLKQFRIDTQLIGVQHGPTFTLYELSLQKGIKVSSVLGLAENIAMDLSVADVRILAPIPGKPAIGVEVPNKKRDTIGFDVMMPTLKGKYYKIPMVLGRTITGDNVVIDLAKTPHLLVAGTTGSGKSVCINGLICSVLYTKTPKEVRMILVDPKMVELSVYNDIPHLLTPVITEPKKALKAMNFVVEEMERRMQLFRAIGAKKIEEYNEKIVEKKLARVKLPYIMIIIDEFADLMLAVGKELESSIKRITAVARFCGIHLVLATQRPSVDVITGIIKSNIPTQIAFAVSNSTNSKIIIDTSGAEKLLGRGDMLYNDPAERVPKRIQGAYIDSEIESIVDYVKTQGEPDYIDESYFEDDEDEEEEDPENVSPPGSEDMFMRAWKIVSDRGEASASYIQRRLNIGYNRAANLIEQMEDAGYVGPARGSKPREVLRLYGSE